MSKEHIFPLWLIDHAKAYHEGIRWLGEKRIPAKDAKLPICRECNSRLGSELEEPVSRILPKVEIGSGINDIEAEFLVRWLWKFEGLFWAYSHSHYLGHVYSDRWTLIERVLGTPIKSVRGALTLAVGLIHENDREFQDWPLGIDSGISNQDGFFVSGVFGKTALMVSLSRFSNLIDPCFGIYQLKAEPDQSDEPCFFPPVCFPFCRDAITTTIKNSMVLKAEHEEYARTQNVQPQILISRPRIEIPS